jgi:hypothetical protein
VWKLRSGGLTPLAVEVATAELTRRGVDPVSNVLDPGFEVLELPPEPPSAIDRVGGFLLAAIKTIGAAAASLLVVGAVFWEFGDHGGGSSAGYLFAMVLIFVLLITQRIPMVGLVLAGATVLFFVSCAANFRWAGG